MFKEFSLFDIGMVIWISQCLIISFGKPLSFPNIIKSDSLGVNFSNSIELSSLQTDAIFRPEYCFKNSSRFSKTINSILLIVP